MPYTKAFLVSMTDWSAELNPTSKNLNNSLGCCGHFFDLSGAVSGSPAFDFSAFSQQFDLLAPWRHQHMGNTVPRNKTVRGKFPHHARL